MKKYQGLLREHLELAGKLRKKMIKMIIISIVQRKLKILIEKKKVLKKSIWQF